MLCVIHETFINISAHVALVKRSEESSYSSAFSPLSLFYVVGIQGFYEGLYLSESEKMPFPYRL